MVYMFNILYQDNQKTYKWGKIGICLEIIEQYLPMIISLSVSHWLRLMNALLFYHHQSKWCQESNREAFKIKV